MSKINTMMYDGCCQGYEEPREPDWAEDRWGAYSPQGTDDLEIPHVPDGFWDSFCEVPDFDSDGVDPDRADDFPPPSGEPSTPLVRDHPPARTEAEPAADEPAAEPTPPAQAEARTIHAPIQVSGPTDAGASRESVASQPADTGQLQE
jgi:hypothetical protein